MVYVDPHIESRMKFRLPGLEVGTPEFEREYGFIAGMLEGQQLYTAPKIVDTMPSIYEGWRRLSYMIARKLNLTPYFRMLEIVDKHPGALQNYKNDLYKIDFEELWANPHTDFIWVLRDLGTHLFPTSRHGYKHEVQGVLKSFGTPMYLGYWDHFKEEFTELDPVEWLLKNTSEANFGKCR